MSVAPTRWMGASFPFLILSYSVFRAFFTLIFICHSSPEPLLSLLLIVELPAALQPF